MLHQIIFLINSIKNTLVGFYTTRIQGKNSLEDTMQITVAFFFN